MRRGCNTAMAARLDNSKRHRAYPDFLLHLGGRKIRPSDALWAMDITFIPIGRGFLFLGIVIDSASCRVLSRRTSLRLEKESCVVAVRGGAERYDRLAILNADQRSQFTDSAITGCCRTTVSLSVWIGSAVGATSLSWNSSGARSGTRRFTCAATSRYPTFGPASAAMLPMPHQPALLENCRPHSRRSLLVVAATSDGGIPPAQQFSNDFIPYRGPKSTLDRQSFLATEL